MAIFHAFMLVCSLTGDTGCSILEGPGSPFLTKDQCQKSVKEGAEAVGKDAEMLKALEDGKVDVRIVCHKAADGFVPEQHYDLLMRLYGPPKGEKA